MIDEVLKSFVCQNNTENDLFDFFSVHVSKHSFCLKRLSVYGRDNLLQWILVLRSLHSTKTAGSDK